MTARRRHPAAGRPGPGGNRPGAVGPAEPQTARIVLADHDRLVVTCDKQANRVFVLRPPGEDPRAILRVARLVLPEGPYGELAEQLGNPPSGRWSSGARGTGPGGRLARRAWYRATGGRTAAGRTGRGRPARC